MICDLGGKLKLSKFTLWGLEDDAAILLLHFTACASPPLPLSVLGIKAFLWHDWFCSVNKNEAFATPPSQCSSSQQQDMSRVLLNPALLRCTCASKRVCPVPQGAL